MERDPLLLVLPFALAAVLATGTAKAAANRR
jgi:hypothetical protein